MTPSPCLALDLVCLPDMSTCTVLCVFLDLVFMLVFQIVEFVKRTANASATKVLPEQIVAWVCCSTCMAWSVIFLRRSPKHLIIDNVPLLWQSTFTTASKFENAQRALFWTEISFKL